MNVKISVITVCLNSEKEIVKTIESVLKQNYNNVEYIIQDGKSTDNTLRFAEKYCIEFENRGLEYRIYSDNDKGIYYAMNEASKKANGDYLIYLNAGDIFAHSNVLNRMALECENTQCDILYGDALMVNDYGVMLFKADMRLVSKRMPFSHQACFIRKDKFEKVLFNENYRIVADYDLILNLYEKGSKFKYLNTIICCYDMNGISSTKFVEKRKEHEIVLEKHGLNNNLFIKRIRIAEAYIKYITKHVFPQSIIKAMSVFYMENIKHYKYWDGSIY